MAIHIELVKKFKQLESRPHKENIESVFKRAADLSKIGFNMELLYNIFASFHVLVVLFTVFCLVCYWYFNLPKDVPPGPLGIPFIGYLPFYVTSSQKTFSKLAQKYGPVFSIYVGQRLIVGLNSYEAIKDAFIKQADVFSGRPANYNFNLAEPEKYSILLSDGSIWKDHRRFAMNVFKECGVGKLSIEPQIMDEIQYFLSALKNLGGKTSDFRDLIALSVSNITCILVFGKRYEYDDKWLNACKRYIDQMTAASSPVTIFDFFPWMRKIPGISYFTNQESYVHSLKYVKDSMYQIISDKNKTHLDGQKDNYVSAYIEEQRETKEKGKFNEIFCDDALEQNMRILIITGTETPSNTIMWFVLLMMKYPEVQKKLQQEIDEIIGPHQTPSYNDRMRTPYMEATIQEVQRFATLLPLNVLHRNTEECVVLGRKIPKDSTIVANLWDVHYDPVLWGDPQNFRPERFLNEKGEVIRCEYLIPFSVGKRQCLGIELARMELYLYFTAMLQKFTFKSPEGTITSLQSRPGITYAPKDFQSRAIFRNVA